MRVYAHAMPEEDVDLSFLDFGGTKRHPSGTKRHQADRSVCNEKTPSRNTVTGLRNHGARDRVRGPAKLAMRLRLRRREPATLSLGNRSKGKK